MNDKKRALTNKSDVDAFLQKVASAQLPKPHEGRGRLMFAMDATASREPTWDKACQLQGQMFEATDRLGGLDIQLVYFRGYDQLRISKWIDKSQDLLRLMSAVRCLGGTTQIRRVLRHALNQIQEKKVNALVFVGDCMEEDVDLLCKLAGELGIQGVPIFIFHEGADSAAEACFRQMASISNGAYCQFDSTSAQQLADLLGAVAVYAAGGIMALADLNKTGNQFIKAISHQLEKK